MEAILIAFSQLSDSISKFRMFSLLMLPVTFANVGVTLLWRAFKIKPMLEAVRCNFDVTFRRS